MAVSEKHGDLELSLLRWIMVNDYMFFHVMFLLLLLVGMRRVIFLILFRIHY